MFVAILGIVACSKEEMREKTQPQMENVASQSPTLMYADLEAFYLTNGWVQVNPDPNFVPSWTGCIVHIWEKGSETRIVYQFPDPTDLNYIDAGDDCPYTYSTGENGGEQCDGDASNCRVKIDITNGSEIICC
jgi:hypothetical protein